MGTVESKQARRNEPVIITLKNGSEREGTIEFGDEEQMSIYCESNGRSTGRLRLDGREETSRVRSDPGGNRPVWDSFRKP